MQITSLNPTGSMIGVTGYYRRYEFFKETYILLDIDEDDGDIIEFCRANFYVGEGVTTAALWITYKGSVGGEGSDKSSAIKDAFENIGYGIEQAGERVNIEDIFNAVAKFHKLKNHIIVITQP